MNMSLVGGAPQPHMLGCMPGAKPIGDGPAAADGCGRGNTGILFGEDDNRDCILEVSIGVSCRGGNAPCCGTDWCLAVADVKSGCRPGTSREFRSEGTLGVA